MRANGTRATKQLGEVVAKVAKWIDARVIVSADGSAKGKGDTKRVSFGLWQGLDVKSGHSETTERMRMRAKDAMYWGRLPGTWDIELAELYAIYSALK